MTSLSAPIASATLSSPHFPTVEISEALPALDLIPKRYPPETLSPEQRIRLGVKVLEQFGETDFCYFFQPVYHLSKEESASIFRLAKEYVKDLVTWSPLDESAYSQEIALIRGVYPAAKFWMWHNHHVNWRFMPVVEIDEGTRYFFYSDVYKGPKVTQSYVDEYAKCKNAERRPNHQVLNGKSEMVFLMELISEQSPQFNEESHLDFLMELITRFSLNKKLLDLLPCRLALKDQEVYCTDPKICYDSYETEREAFDENVKALKASIHYQGFAEEPELLACVDRLAQKYYSSIFEKDLESLPTGFTLKDEIPPERLTQDLKIDLAAAYLKRKSSVFGGATSLPYIASTYGLSVEDQWEAKRRAGDEMIENTVEWKSEIRDTFVNLHFLASNTLIEHGLTATFAMYTNNPGCLGNSSPVLTVRIDEQLYVVSKCFPSDIREYKQRQAGEHRPSFRLFPLKEEGEFLLLTKFMGSELIDYSNEQHLDLLVKFIFDFSASGTIDFNPVNLIIHDNQLYYVDRDVEYEIKVPKNRLLNNLKELFNRIKVHLHTPEEQEKCKRYVREKIDFLLNLKDPQHREVSELFFLNEESFKQALHASFKA